MLQKFQVKNLMKSGMVSESVLTEMRSEGKQIEQEVSYVAGNNVFCIYNADSEETIKEHANRAGVPANEITLIPNVLRHNTSKG